MVPNPQPQGRRPRGFAAVAAGGASGKGKKEREKEKERTKLRERHRRAITSRMLAGLRQYGNFPLPARADMNDVLAALAREAGWVVDADGTTYRQSPMPMPMPVPVPTQTQSQFRVESPTVSGLGVKATATALECVLGIDESLSPASLDSSVVIGERDNKYATASASASVSPINSTSVQCSIEVYLHNTLFFLSSMIIIILIICALCSSLCKIFLLRMILLPLHMSLFM